MQKKVYCPGQLVAKKLLITNPTRLLQINAFDGIYIGIGFWHLKIHLNIYNFAAKRSVGYVHLFKKKLTFKCWIHMSGSLTLFSEANVTAAKD